MTAPLKSVQATGDLADSMRELGQRAKTAARVLALAPTQQKNEALAAMAQECRARKGDIRPAGSVRLRRQRHGAAYTRGRAAERI